MARFLPHCCCILTFAFFLLFPNAAATRHNMIGGGATIQAAIDAVPMGNKKWVTIVVKAGVYREKVKIPAGKEFIYLKGEGMGRTVVTWGDHDSMLSSATFESLADNILVSGISFVNSYNYPAAGGVPVKAAVAAKISGDKAAFFECSFSGYQDTLLDDAGRHYFKECTVEGAIDFIFGGGQSIYERCRIWVNGGTIKPAPVGYITAQARNEAYNGGGFVFKQCNVTGNCKAFLGRAWKSYSRALYYRSYLSDIVVPPGWDAWSSAGHESQLTFAEEECYGLGSNKRNRVRWEKTLSRDQLRSLTSITFVDSDGWMQKLPLKIQYL
ncbi:probable pectinesterase 29 [Andrographis paniculata]|uniref:probable pectinesterase 29 n=1 Tax=Andrographis paniculata TaxID=175694 RepID=UPI0021E84B43|nr:probable pectinesterase 29 [Andrographis paniculata]